jgi:Mg/Co/Ni transporter MgtE
MDKNIINSYIPEEFNSLDEFLQNAFSPDIAELIDELDGEELKYIFGKITKEVIAEVISHLD